MTSFTITLSDPPEVSHAGRDVRFVSSPSGTVHERPESDDEDHDYAFHPKCGQRLPDGSKWGVVDAETAEEAVMRFNLVPCSKCIASSRQLDHWRKDVHSPTVMHNADTPEKWTQ